MTVPVIKIKNQEAYLIRKKTLDSYLKFTINGVVINNELKKEDITLSGKDVLKFIPSSKTLIHYKRKDKVLSIEEYKAKPTYYDVDSSDEETLRRIANKKELEGFEAVYKEIEEEDVELNIIGYIEDTKSNFIECSLSANPYQTNPLVYTATGREIALDEYKILSEKHSSDAKFQKPDRNYLRFTQINNKYAFHDSYPFGDNNYRKTFLSLDEAKAEEEKIRTIVKNVIENTVFKEDLTNHKNLQLLERLKLTKQLKSKKTMDEMLNTIIKDLSRYLSIVKQ